MSKELFPTFSRWLSFIPILEWPSPSMRAVRWRGAPWWPGESLVSNQFALLRMLAVAHRERLPLVPLLRSLDDEFRWRYRRRVRQLDRLLTQNVSLVSAIEQVPDLLPNQMVLALRFGSQSGILNETYEQLLSTEPNPLDVQRGQSADPKIYWLMLLITMVIVMTLLTYFISPTIRKMCSEFDMTIPSTFRSLRIFWSSFESHPILMIGAIGLLGWCFFSRVARRIWHRSWWYQWIWGTRQEQFADLYQLMAIAVEAGRPLNGTLSTLARYHFDKGLRHQLLQARNEMEQGVDGWESLSAAKLLTPEESQALSQSPSNQVRAWALRRMSVDKYDRARQQARRVITILHPVVILLFAGMVMWVCVSYFQVLSGLIYHTAQGLKET